MCGWGGGLGVGGGGGKEDHVIYVTWIKLCILSKRYRPETSNVSNDTGWRPVVVAYQWWPFAFCTDNYVFVASQIRQFCKRKQKEPLQKRQVKFSVWEAKS